jgi:hypothetical protein
MTIADTVIWITIVAGPATRDTAAKRLTTARLLPTLVSTAPREPFCATSFSSVGSLLLGFRISEYSRPNGLLYCRIFKTSAFGSPTARSSAGTEQSRATRFGALRPRQWTMPEKLSPTLSTTTTIGACTAPSASSHQPILCVGAETKSGRRALESSRLRARRAGFGEPHETEFNSLTTSTGSRVHAEPVHRSTRPAMFDGPK